MDASSEDFWFVMPVHTRGPVAAGYLEQSLASLAVQTDPGWRLVLVLDTASEEAAELRRTVDGSVAAAGVAGRTVILVQPNRQGPGSARNAGVAYAGDAAAAFVAFLDSDDVCRPDRLAVTRAAFAADDRVDMFYSAFEVIDEQGDLRGPAQLPGSIVEILERQDGAASVSPRPWRRMACVDGYLSLTSTVAMRVELAASTPFPATYVSEDWHTWLRAFAAARHVAYSAEPLTRYRVPTAQASGSRSEQGHFSYLKALVDADAVARVLLSEVARGGMTEQQALQALAEHQRMAAGTARSDSANTLADTLQALADM